MGCVRLGVGGPLIRKLLIEEVNYVLLSPALPAAVRRGVVVSACASALILAISSFVAPSAYAADAPAVVVKMQDKAPMYDPPKVTIKAGQTVEWVNEGQTVHNATTNASMAQDKNDVALPAGAEAFDSGFLPPGGKFSHTFKVPGTYKYFCVPHEKAGMVGTVVVTK